MVDRIEITLIGAGNLAWHLGPALENCGYPIREVYSRNPANARTLIHRLYTASLAEGMDFSGSDSSLFLLCVPDDALESVASEILIPPGAMIAHCSGSTHLDILGSAGFNQRGVFYPLQTFTKGRPLDFREVPVLVEAGDQHTGRILTNMAKDLTKIHYMVNSEDRFAIHLSAVFASNFTNHLLKISSNILKERGYELDLLFPVIAETIQKSMETGPLLAQTGPARRGDLRVLDRQMAFLSGSPAEDLYRLISQQILDAYPEP